MNSDNDVERDIAIAEHTKAISDRINELADRDYFRLPGLNSPEVVIMYSCLLPFNPFLDAAQYRALVSTIYNRNHWFQQVESGSRVTFSAPPAE